MPDTYHIPVVVPGPSNATWVMIESRPIKHADLPPHAIHASNSAPAFSFVSGQEEVEDPITGEPVLQDIVQAVPYGVLDNDGPRSPTAEEWAAWEPWEAGQQQQAALVQAQDDLAGYGPIIGALAQYLAAFPDIHAGADYPTCQQVILQTLEAATVEEYKALNIAKDMAQTIFERTLKPAGIFGDRLWTAIAMLQQQ